MGNFMPSKCVEMRGVTDELVAAVASSACGKGVPVVTVVHGNGTSPTRGGQNSTRLSPF